MSISVSSPAEVPVRFDKSCLQESDGPSNLMITANLLEKIRDLWAQVLQQDPTDFQEEDGFFEVGGDSISALDLSLAAQEQGISLTMEQIFTFPSLEEMVQTAVLSQEQPVHSYRTTVVPFELLGSQDSIKQQIQLAANACGIPTNKVMNAYPCTPMQQSLVAAADGAENHYVRQLVFEFTEDAPLQNLQKAWEATIYANSVLQTRICHLKHYGYVQVVVDDEIKWRESTSLKEFLVDDSNTPMPLGSQFFRYTIIKEKQSIYFVWTVHHALCDGASILEILAEVSQRFGHESPPQREPYDAFVKSILTRDLDMERDFWRSSLGGIDAPAYPPLPTTGFVSESSATVEYQVTIENISKFDLTRALLLRAAWAILLSHHTGTEDVAFGAIVNGRSSSAVSGIDRMTGPTIGLVPIALHLNPKQSVHSFLDRVRSQAAELMPFEQTGIPNLRRYLSGRSTASDFQNLFVVHPASLGEATAPFMERLGLKHVSQSGKIEHHPYPLVVQATLSSGDQVELIIQYDERVLSYQYARNLGNQFQAVISQLGQATEETTLDSISPLNDKDLAQIGEWNKVAPTAEDACFQDVFRKQLFRAPFAPAVCSLDRSLTYAELDNISSGLAAQLIRLGVQTGSFVVVCFEKSIWTVAAMIAVFKAGGAYVPIDPAYPRGRIEEVVNMVEVTVAMVSPSCEAIMKELCRHIVVVDDPPISYISSLLDTRASITHPNDTAYLLFTSGSTGKPKGVEIPHSALCTSILHHGRAYGAGPDWRTLQFSAHTFDASAAEFFTTLAFGGCICVPSDHDRLNNLGGVITALDVNTALLTPTVANIFSPDDVPTLQRIILGGEPVTKETLMRWAGHVSLTNGYGPSESTIYSAANVNLSVDTNPAYIGRSVGATMWIVDANNHNQLSAIGCVGEIVISGGLLAKGYYGEPELTAASFIPAPQWLRDLQPYSSYDRIYKTGDLARYTPDGIFHIIGRKDTQVKLRGLRIELGEIESRIMELRIATMGLAFLPSRGPCERQIVAVLSHSCVALTNQSDSDIVVAEDNHDEWLQKVQTHLRFTLPEYMVPTIWLVLQRAPLLISGKVDRKAIRAWVESMPPKTYKQVTRSISSDVEDIQIPQGSLADNVRQIWSQVLNVSQDQIGMNSSFFGLGGDSISAIQMVSKGKSVGLSMTVKGIISTKTLRNLVRFIQEDSPCTPGSFDLSQIPRETNQPFALSPIQRLFFNTNKPVLSSARFNQGFLLRIQSFISNADLQRAFSAVVGRHPMLRTVISIKSGWQKQATNEDFRFRKHGQLTIDQVKTLIEIGHKSIEIETGPVFSVDIFEMGDDTYVFLTAHHFVVDLVSWRIIMQDLEDFLTTSSFQTLATTSFYQWTKFLETTFASEGVPVATKTGLLSQNLEFLGFDEAHNTYADVETIEWTLTQTETRNLLDISSQDITAQPVEVIIAAVAKSYSKAFGSTCPSIFVEGHGREILDSGLDLSNTVGWFTVMYPLDDFPDPSAALQDFINKVQNGRKEHPDNGLSYFSRALLASEYHQDLMFKPIQFNYHGAYQQFENEDSIFRMAEIPGVENHLIGNQIRRTSIFEIEAAIHQGRLQFSLSFPKHLKKIPDVFNWVSCTKESLENLTLRLSESAISLIPRSVAAELGQEELVLFHKAIAEKICDQPSVKVEDAYFCSPMQLEMLEKQRKSKSVFILSWEMEILTTDAQSICLDQLARAWQRVVQRHPILRTIFLNNQHSKGRPLQVILSNIEAGVSVLSSDLEIEEQGHSLASTHGSILPHWMCFFQRGDSIFGRLKISHLAIDGWSLGIIKEDLLTAYWGKSLAPGAPYKNFISAHEQSNVIKAREYWKSALVNQPSCLLRLPVPDDSSLNHSMESRIIISLPALDTQSLAKFCTENGVTTASIINAAWAQTLSVYTGSPRVTFGYVVSGRDLEIDQVDCIVGPLINVLPHYLSNVSCEKSRQNLAELAEQIQSQRIQDSNHVFCNIAELAKDELGINQLFNSAVNFQRRPTALEMNDLQIKDLPESRDPWHFDVFVRVVCGNDGAIEPQLEFNPTILDREKMEGVARCFWERITSA